MKKLRKEMTPGLHLQVFQGTPEQCEIGLQEWFKEFDPVAPVSINHGFAGGEFWLSIVFMLPTLTQGAMLRPGGLQ